MDITRRAINMSNKTIFEAKIKQRGDGVYDLYINGTWVVSRGHYENILEEVRNAIKVIDSKE
jgi:hypothetical protein